MIIGFLTGLVFGAFFAVLITRPDLREKLFAMMNKGNQTPAKKTIRKPKAKAKGG